MSLASINRPISVEPINPAPPVMRIRLSRRVLFMFFKAGSRLRLLRGHSISDLADAEFCGQWCFFVQIQTTQLMRRDLSVTQPGFRADHDPTFVGRFER